ncbi:MAG: hypothetical protein Q7S60_03865 [bacterium]|nr:hypothetical protein [bacterium]
MKKVLIYYNFILVTIITVSGFLGATSIPQLLSAVIFFPLAVYFWLRVVPRRRQALLIPDRVLVIPNVIPKVTEPEKDKAEEGHPGFDINRRTFVKLIGSAGLALFLFAMFTKKSQQAFFGKDPAAAQESGIKHPTDGYTIARIDDGSPAFYGFLNKEGSWFIMREESDGVYKYAKGASDFLEAGWGTRDMLAYGEFNTVFD